MDPKKLLDIADKLDIYAVSHFKDDDLLTVKACARSARMEVFAGSSPLCPECGYEIEYHMSGPDYLRGQARCRRNTQASNTGGLAKTPELLCPWEGEVKNAGGIMSIVPESEESHPFIAARRKHSYGTINQTRNYYRAKDYKVIARDNYDRDYVSEWTKASDLTKLAALELADKLNKETNTLCDWYFVAVPNDYVLRTTNGK